MIRFVLASCALVALTAPAFAQDMPVQPGIVALTPEQREAALEAGAVRARDESLQYGAGDRRVHGEMGVEVGTRGERAAYGTLVAPIGQNGVAAISYGTGQGPRWRGRNGRFRDTSMGVAYSSDTASARIPDPDGTETVNPD